MPPENPSMYSVFKELWRNILVKLNDYILTEVFVGHVEDADNPHTVTKEQIGLENVDNTSDANKPISTLTQEALDKKSDDGHTHWSDDIEVWVDALAVECGGTGYDSIRDTTYTTPRYRASALVSYEGYPEYNGVINWVYE